MDPTFCVSERQLRVLVGLVHVGYPGGVGVAFLLGAGLHCGDNAAIKARWSLDDL
jgi:hypothetical protein